MKLFVAQPMSGIDDVTINRKMHAVQSFYKHLLPNEKVELIDQVNIPIPDDKKNLDSDKLRKFLLSRSVNLLLNEAELVVFLPGWETAKGCRVEMTACTEYDIPYVKPETLCDAMRKHRYEGDKVLEIFPEIENVKTETAFPLPVYGSIDVPHGELWVPDTNHELYDGQRIIGAHLPAYHIDCIQELIVRVKKVDDFLETNRDKICMAEAAGYKIGFIDQYVATELGLDVDLDTLNIYDNSFTIYSDAPVKSSSWFRKYESEWKNKSDED